MILEIMIIVSPYFSSHKRTDTNRRENKYLLYRWYNRWRILQDKLIVRGRFSIQIWKFPGLCTKIFDFTFFFRTNHAKSFDRCLVSEGSGIDFENQCFLHHVLVDREFEILLYFCTRTTMVFPYYNNEYNANQKIKILLPVIDQQ